MGTAHAGEAEIEGTDRVAGISSMDIASNLQINLGRILERKDERMLTRFRIEVEGAESAAACEAELSKYEHAMQVTEARRYDIIEEYVENDGSRTRAVAQHHPWDISVEERDFYNSQLGREVTDEVIEYDASLPGYKGRRVVQFKRVDKREMIYGRADQQEIGSEARLDAQRLARETARLS